MIITSTAKQATRSAAAITAGVRLVVRHMNHPGAAATGARIRSQSRIGRSNNRNSSSDSALYQYGRFDQQSG